MSLRDYDAIIIGAGIGGLTSGAWLARHGRKVLICEQHHRPGGYCASYRRGGFTFDEPHMVGGLKKGLPARDILDYLGVSDLVNLVEIPVLDTYCYPDYTVRSYTDIKRTEEDLCARFPSARADIRNCLSEETQIWQAACELKQHRPYNGGTQNSNLPPGLQRVAGQSYLDFVRSFTGNARLADALGSGWPRLGLHYSAASALAMIVMRMSYHIGGAWYPKGGFQKLSDAFVKRFKESGGELRLATPVTKILVEAGRAVGVELDDGELLRAQWVVSDADTSRTLTRLLRSTKQPSDLRPSASAVVVHLGLKTSLPVELDCGWLFRFAGDDTGRQTLGDLFPMTDALSQSPLSLSSPTIRDPSLAPPGCSILDITRMPASHAAFAQARQKGYEQYRSLKEESARRLIAAAEELIPGLSENILVTDIATPVTYRRYTGAAEGCWYDLALTPSRVLASWHQPYIPVSGLLMTGAKSFLGFGVSGAINAGWHTAQFILNA